MHYIYQFLDANEQVIYVGITCNLKGRLRAQHFTSNGHLPKECYEETEFVIYSECISIDDAKIRERYLINVLAPKFNEKMNNGSRFSFMIDDFNWKYLGVDKSKIQNSLEQRNKINEFQHEFLCEVPSDENIKSSIETALARLAQGVSTKSYLFSTFDTWEDYCGMSYGDEGWEKIGISFLGRSCFFDGRFIEGHLPELPDSIPLHIRNKLGNSRSIYVYSLCDVRKFIRQAKKKLASIQSDLQVST